MLSLFKKLPSMAGVLFFGITLRLFLPSLVLAQGLPIPATGFFNSYLSQKNIVECDNGNPEGVTLRLTVRSSGSQVLGQTTYDIPDFGSRHIILNDLVNLGESYGSYSLELLSNPALAARLSCRTAFYRFAAPNGPKQLEFAYAIPVRLPLSGVSGGLFNSYNPSHGAQPTLNWLSVINMSNSPFPAMIDLYDFSGNLLSTFSLPTLAPFERRDIALGHPAGEVTGIYRIRPENNLQNYDAFLVRYGANGSSYDFAFPLRAQAGGCSDIPVQISTMGNGLTNNWLEVLNLGPQPAAVHVIFRDRFGAVLRDETVNLPPFGQQHLFANTTIDPQGVGNVGSAVIQCNDPNSHVLLQSAFYGRIPSSPKIEWAYAVQGMGQESANETQQLAMPVNTYLGMANWYKAANLSPSGITLRHTVINQAGNAVGAGERQLPTAGTADIGIHEVTGYDFGGSLLSSTPAGQITGEILRVLSRTDGQIGNIMHIPAVVQPYTTPPVPPSGYFPPGAVWYQDISQAPLDAQSSQVIQWLQNAGGWGTGILRIDYSIEVLHAAPNTPFRSFTRTSDFYDPDCDYTEVPIPPGGAIEGESGYQCVSDGDCHLLVEHRASGTLYEMWRANIVGGTFFGGCLVRWDMNRVYGPSGRGENCTSADAAGYPIAPLLFTADEVAAGSINHAIRFILPNARIRRGVYLHPATHSTSAASGGSNAPPYGTRLRLRANFPLSSLPNEGARVVARAMQKYGILLSDGGNIALTAQSDRFTTAKWDGLLGTRDLASILVSDFEMVDGGARIPYTGDCVRNP